MKEDRLEDMLRAMDHPEEYSEEELTQLLSDEELREYYELAVKAKEGFLLNDHRPAQSHKRPIWLKVAAAIIGVLMVSGITLAAVSLINHRQESWGQVHDPGLGQATCPHDSASFVNGSPVRTFENVELETILNEAAKHYQVSVEYRTEQVRRIRLYTKWNPQAPLSELIERLNGFEKVSIKQEDNHVIAE